MTEVTLTPSATLGVARSASTGAFATLIFFVLCWTAAVAGLSLTHALIGLFTLQPLGSAAALFTGGLWAWVGGGIAGALVAHCYNLAGRIFGLR